MLRAISDRAIYVRWPKTRIAAFTIDAPIKSSNVYAWLAPGPSRRVELREILADRERPY
ncbi:hypothetical protein ACVBGC_32655 [Burkholderia stagnalis]